MADVDAAREIRRAVDTGKVIFGSKVSLKNVLLSKGKLLVIASNTPKEQLENMKHISNVSGIPIYEYEGTGLELGRICGKPFVITSLLVLEQGKSKVTMISKQ